MKKKTVVILFLAWVMVGFRVYSNNTPWNVTPGAPRLWVKWCTTYTTGTNDLENGDPLYGQTPTFQQVVDSVYNDFNQIPGAFVEVYDAATDGTYNATVGADHTIDICQASVSHAGSGEARHVYTDNRLTGCTITLTTKTFEKLSSFVSTLTHELGHCLGLDHPQELTNSIMSYYARSNYHRLQIDDKMGLVFLYPVDPDSAREKATFGLSCSPAE